MESHLERKRFTFLYQHESRVKRLLELGCKVEFVGRYTPMVTAIVSSWKQMRQIERDSELTYVDLDRPLQLFPYQMQKIHYKKGNILQMKQKKEYTPWNIRKVFRNYNRTYTGKGVRIGVIDTGIDLTHPDLRPNIRGGVNIVEPGKLPMDLNGHGSHVAGIIGAAHNQLGIVGVAPAVSLYAIKVLSKNGVGSLSNLVRGIEWGITNGMNILNISISGGTVIPAPLEQAVRAATRRGIFVVAAAGNEGKSSGKGDTVEVPARIPTAIGVAAVNKNNQRASFSATGPSVDLSAPGVGIVSSYSNKKYAILSGTSMAAAHVSGVLALHKQKDPRDSYTTILKRLYSCAKDLSPLGRDPYTGFGLVQF